ncbi:S24 family peptidase [Oceaniovalibus sp. ACAM 378]|uniref:S24 family peptidase n=1 Tax=Oceaniovalibus sp. ACAM 378 TaxID=2599923 RepID=UPI0011D35717|nr:S24 family peptidase [Oceaniovalibus sp. ACAM 378]TYB85843.1 XRE family transcriptional regulator [Oceaniovalibus sp. ACAM 378]
MTTTFREAFMAALAATKIPVRRIASDSGVSYEQLKKFSQGKTESTNADDAIRIARAFGVSMEQFLRGELDPSRQSAIAVVGHVGAGARVPLNDSYSKGDGHYHVACPPQLTPKGLACVEICGSSMEPAYLDGDLLFYSRPAMGVPSEAVGARCIVEDADGMAWVKFVRRRDGQPEGLFDLVSFHADHPPMYDCALHWAAPILMHQQKAFAERIEPPVD